MRYEPQKLSIFVTQFCGTRQGIYRSKTSIYQDICIYPEKEFIIYNCYWSIAYTCGVEPTNGQYILPKFSNAVFNSVESKVEFNISHKFRKVYQHLYYVGQQTPKIVHFCCTILRNTPRNLPLQNKYLSGYMYLSRERVHYLQLLLVHSIYLWRGTY